MTTSAEPRLKLLVVENDRPHFEQIEGELSKHGYEVVQMTTYDPAGLYNYKAIHGENQIVIVDYHLGGSEESREGRDRVQAELWEVDRMAIFIGFSRFVHERAPDNSVELRAVQPYRVLVPKSVDGDGRITQESLDELARVVNRCREIAVPVLAAPRHEAYPMARELEDFLREAPSDRPEYTREVKERIFESAAVLTRLCTSAAPYARAGRRATRLAVGVYGSCGRMEKRRSSDIEFSVLYDPGEEVEDRELLHLAVTCWNRMARFCHKNRLAFELQEHLHEDPLWVLSVNDVKAQLTNSYLPVIDIGTLLRTDLQRNASVRNRYYQILTELRPVFNPDLVFRLKRTLLRNGQELPRHLVGIIDSSHLQDIFTQFATDTRPELLDDRKQLKRFTARFMNVLACRLALLRELHFENPALQEDRSRWQALFDALTEPGIVKVARFANVVRRKLRDPKALTDSLNAVMSKYFDLLYGYNNLPDDGLANDPEIRAEVKELRRVSKHLTEEFVELFERIAKEEAFKESLSRADWLVDTQPVEKAARIF